MHFTNEQVQLLKVFHHIHTTCSHYYLHHSDNYRLHTIRASFFWSVCRAKHNVVINLNIYVFMSSASFRSFASRSASRSAADFSGDELGVDRRPNVYRSFFATRNLSFSYCNPSFSLLSPNVHFFQNFYSHTLFLFT